jgi:hypothetical protein
VVVVEAEEAEQAQQEAGLLEPACPRTWPEEEGRRIRKH